MSSDHHNSNPNRVQAFLDELLSANFRGEAKCPGDEGYDKLNRRWNMRTTSSPLCILSPEDETSISIGLKAARRQYFGVGVQCGGHHAGKTAAPEDGILIHMKKIRHVELDRDDLTIRFGGGCLWSDVYGALLGTGLECTGGGVHNVGVGGFLTGGGYSFWSGQHGMGCHNVVEVEVVTPEGDIMRASDKENQHIFWGVRGGGNNFGVVTSFRLRVHPMKTQEFTTGVMAFEPAKFERVLQAVDEFVRKQTSTEVLNLNFTRMPPHFQPCLMLMPWFAGDAERRSALLAPFLEIGPVFEEIKVAHSQLEVSRGADAFFEFLPERHAYFACQVTRFDQKAVLEAGQAFLRASEGEKWKFSGHIVELHHLSCLAEDSGAAARVNAVWRANRKHIYVLCQMSYNDAKDDPEADAKVQKYREQAYSIYAQCGDDPTTWMYGAEDGASSEKVWGEQLSRMKALRLKVDPQGIMRGPNVIPVASS